ncbi:MAG: hypothetical protein DMD91_34040 [Candidatus Rokuibacteriota bacterium]|nr:MAG: hypothetical protein DMD91_34040 [Candidatus Rokubacteria bacterium]
MKRTVTVVALLVLAAVPLLVVPKQVSAGSSTDAALALGAFAVFNQIVRGETIFNGSPHVVRETVVVEQPVVIQQPPAVIYTPPPAVVYGPPPVIYAPAPPPTVYYVPAPTPVYAYPYGYPHYRAAYRW